MDWYLGVLKRYADFNGRARRKEYWMFFLINLLIAVAISVVEAFIGTGGLLGALYALGVLLPSIAVGARRLHDVNKSGWFLLIALVPIVGVFILLYFLVKDSDAGANQYGPNPKAGAA